MTTGMSWNAAAPDARPSTVSSLSPAGEPDGEALVRGDRKALDLPRARRELDVPLRYRDLRGGRPAVEEIAARPLTVEAEAVGIERHALSAQVLAVRGHAPDARRGREDERLGAAGEAVHAAGEEVDAAVVPDDRRRTGKTGERPQLIAARGAKPADDAAGRLHEQLVLGDPVRREHVLGRRETHPESARRGDVDVALRTGRALHGRRDARAARAEPMIDDAIAVRAQLRAERVARRDAVDAHDHEAHATLDVRDEVTVGRPARAGHRVR